MIPCKKKPFDWLGAQIALADMDRKSKRNSQQAQLRAELRAYRCTDCGRFHISSTPEREEQAA